MQVHSQQLYTEAHTHTHFIHHPPHRLQCPVELKTIDDGEHRLSRPQDIELILESLGNLLLPVSEDTDSKICSSSESED